MNRTKGFIMKGNKNLLNLKRMLARIVPISAIAAMSFAASCEKPEEPTPPTPAPEPVVPTKVVVIDWDWSVDPKLAPSKDSIKYYTDQSDVKEVYINLMNKRTDVFPELTGTVCDGFRASAFHRARDTMQTRFDMSEKVKGTGTILVSNLNGAQLPDTNSGLAGMAEVDSIWFASKGFTIKRRGANKSK